MAGNLSDLLIQWLETNLSSYTMADNLSDFLYNGWKLV